MWRLHRIGHGRMFLAATSTKPKASGPATLPDLETVADRAAQSGASERTQRMADKVARESPELARKVAHGEITLPQMREVAPPTDTRPEPEPIDDLQGTH